MDSVTDPVPENEVAPIRSIPSQTVSPQPPLGNTHEFVSSSSMPPLQFLHVPARPSTRKHTPHLPTKAPIPVFTLKNLPDLTVLKSSMSHPSQIAKLTEGGSSAPKPEVSAHQRPPTAPTVDHPAAGGSREGSARGSQTARSLFGGASMSRYRLGSGGSCSTRTAYTEKVTTPSHNQMQQSDVCWTTDESPRIASASKQRPPPLVALIQQHLSKEMHLLMHAAKAQCTSANEPQAAGSTTASPSKPTVGNGGGEVLFHIDPMEALHPHREAMRMLIEGLPSYAGLLNSIMVAYDSVVKQQAVGASVAREISNSAIQVQQAHDSHVQRLHGTIATLELKIKELQQALVAKNNEIKHANSNPTLNKLERENAELKEKVAALEYEKSCDLERLMTLIAAIKECDSRVKTLEDALQDAKTQLEEMNALRKMMGESQAELGLMKITFRDAVPLVKFQNATKELEAMLHASRQETKRVRRLCIARGSTIEVIEKKLRAATEELERFRSSVGAKSVRDALTPRPNWLKIHKELPELADYAADVPMPMLDGDLAAKLAPGLRETSLQVEFLVEKVKELETNNEVLKAAQSNSINASQEGSRSDGHSSRHRPSVANSSVGATQASPSPQRSGSPNLSANQSHPQRPFLLALGTKPSTPQHLRDIGFIPRIPLDSSKVRELVHDYFSSTPLRKNPEAALLFTEVDLSRFFCSFVSQQFALNPELRTKFNGSVPALAYNILFGQILPLLPQVLLLQGVLEGTIPLAIPFAALEQEQTLQTELQKMCDVHNKTRLRKQIVHELIGSLFPFKTQQEVDELKATLPVENTVDIPALIHTRSRLMETLFEQECGQGLRVYMMFLEKVTASSTISDQVRVVTTSAVLSAIAEVEPRTTQRVIDGLIEGGYEEERTFPLEFTINALKTHLITRTANSE